jgi:hypothetical protein
MRPLVRKLFEKDQRQGGDLLELYGNSYGRARWGLIGNVAGKDVATQEALRQNINSVRDDLAGPNPTPLERILSERVALCWFDAHETDRRYVDQSGLTFKEAEYHEARRDRAHKRFLAACKTLATVRKLALPALQVNIGANQVNQA